ncbi:MAG: aspartate aminotransferase family protein [Fimbriimonadaceae bacterium]|nr:aspartate aminotransferase family protein [Fimbriimonadaceae bacterium]QYK59107.1 MAG: aspartate aminotransferase family protein [Fimbriimonadaceae bacterium]
MDGEALRARVVDQYSQFVNPGLARLMGFAGFGVEVEAQGCWVTDQDGRRYLDCLGGFGVFSLGHRHPQVVEAVKVQIDRMPLSCKTFFNPLQAELAERLAGVAPEGLQFTFFSNSGAEAVEAALKMAKAATRRTKIVSAVGGYHGKTLGSLSVTGREKYQLPFEPLLPGVVHVPYGDTEAGVAAVDETTACVIIEPVQGEGGIHVPPDGYLRALRQRCDQTGALLILDEVQTGLGRTGRMFGSEWEGVSPDLMTLAKCLGGGVAPIGATMGSAAVWERVFGENPLLHTSTFGGNQLACAAGIAALDVIEREGLVKRSLEVGGLLLDGLQGVADRSDLVTEARGRGLMIGVELALDEVGELVTAQMLKRGVIVAYTLNNPRVIRFEPPLIISETEIDVALESFEEAVAETASLLAAYS